MIPDQYQLEIEKLSKDDLMDIAWEFATLNVYRDDPQGIMIELRRMLEIVRERREPGTMR